MPCRALKFSTAQCATQHLTLKAVTSHSIRVHKPLIFDREFGTPVVRYINILTWLRGFREFLSFLCLTISKGDLDAKKTTPNIEVCPESLRCHNIDVSNVAYCCSEQCAST